MTDDGMNDDLRDKKLSNLYREAAREEPPMKLDSVVLGEARKAVEKKSAERKSWWRRISVVAPLATTAVALLTVSLAIQMKQQHPETLAPATVEEAEPSIEGLMKEEVRQRQKQDGVKRKAVSPAPALKAAQPAVGVAEPKRQQFMGRSQLMEREKTQEADRTSSLADTTTEHLGIPPKAASNMTPEVWLERIRSLLKQGRKEEAREELEDFRFIYPDYELPADLAQLKRPANKP